MKKVEPTESRVWVISREISLFIYFLYHQQQQHTTEVTNSDAIIIFYKQTHTQQLIIDEIIKSENRR